MTRSIQASRRCVLNTKAAALALALSLLAVTAQPVHAQSRNSALYYQMGGSAPSGLANYKSNVSNQLGLAADLRLNYSCGKFDIGFSWSTIMNGLSSLGSAISGAISAGIAALPMYIFQRAQPGLHNLFQTYSAKADLLISASLKTCEEMEKSIKAGNNPYQEFVDSAKDTAWRTRASLKGDVVAAKTAIDKNEEGQKNGVSWVFGGAKAGGIGTQPLRPVRDLSVAGYNVTLNRAPSVAATTPGTVGARLVGTFPTPESLASWTTQVLGDKQIYLCEGIVNCPAATTSSTATGLGPRLDAELDITRSTLGTLLASSGVDNGAALNSIATPGMAITPQLLEALRAMPPDTRALAAGRLAHELAMQRVIDKALMARSVLLAGLSLPEVPAAGNVTKDIEGKVARLTQLIEDLMFEHRIRKEMTSNTALSILEDATVRDSQAARLGRTQRTDQAPLENGRVKP
jgi:integrating conjugative element protein (TIGR03755 family)